MANIYLHGVYTICCYDSTDQLLWTEKSENRIVDEGLAYFLDYLFNLDSVTSQLPFYIGLLGADPEINPDDTMTSHPGWQEITDYDETERKEYIPLRNALNISNTDNPVKYTINTQNTEGIIVGGSYITSDQVKGGTDGLLISASSFINGNKRVTTGQYLTVTYKFSAHSA